MTWPISGGVGSRPSFKKFQPNRQHIEKAELLNEGEIIVAYRRGHLTCIETEQGKYPYVWIKEDWLPLREGHVEHSESDL